MSKIDSNPHQANPYPAAYQSPSMGDMPGNNTQYSTYPEGQDSPNPSPPAASVLSLNLPPIRSVDGRPHHPAASQHQQQGQGHPPMQFYQPYPMPPPPQDLNAPIRYPLPPNPDGRIMSGGRYKKEIKRRTKTGCLTCRKRRIKCDEGHPACRNCQKSKRECLGYDPIFKPQPGPATIQPSTSSAPSMYHTPPAQYAMPTPQCYTPASYGAPVFSPDNAASETSQNTAIDPALESSLQENIGDDDPLIGPEQARRAKRSKLEDLLCINGISPPPPAPPSILAEEMREEVKQIYNTAYAPGMDKFLETRWFTERGANHLMANSVLCDQFALLIHRYAMNPQDPSYYVHLGITQSLEAMVVWSMLGMCRKVAKDGEEADMEVKESLLDAAKRLEIFEALVTGEYMEPNSAPKDPEIKPTGTPLQGQLKAREHEFWRLVHTFLTLRDDDASTAKAIGDTLSTCRGLLESRENRDVIYSIMIVRHLGARVPEFPNVKQPETNDEKDTNAKLAVAKRLVEDEASGKGTNQVVQRLCGVAARSWMLKR
ncbi:MAG: hypothetical protein Q9163_000901 [Psora crenata]